MENNPDDNDYIAEPAMARSLAEQAGLVGSPLNDHQLLRLSSGRRVLRITELIDLPGIRAQTPTLEDAYLYLLRYGGAETC